MTTPTSPLAEDLSDIFADLLRLHAKTRFARWNAPLDADMKARRLFVVYEAQIGRALESLVFGIRKLGQNVPSSLDEVIARSLVYDRFDIPSMEDNVADLRHSTHTLVERLEQAGRHEDCVGVVDTHRLACKAILTHLLVEHIGENRAG